MKFLVWSKILLILILPLILFLLVLHFAGFDNVFYQKKFLEYNSKNISLHGKVINFITGKINELPNEFNEREKQHLFDVRSLVKISTITLYVFIILFVILLLSSAFILKVNNKIINFVSKVLIYGGFLTLGLALILFLLINTDFSSAFGSFHKLFFQQGTYVFDPAKEIIVNLYPEELFMDLGLRMSNMIIIGAVIAISIGALLLFKAKKHK